ncbi:MAG TPA: ATP-binding protein [Candidatus Limnocylindria bacterium]|jgi:predicted AAA+ superfamily ATPase|nr:ATP-binding protein [Candidatus Limnocylindria bacterium]
MRYERSNLLGRIEEGLGTEPVTMLLGPRQCGKTTLARYYDGRPDTHWFDLENYLHRSRLEDNPLTTLSSLRGRVVLDEVQTLPNLFPTLRWLADRPELPARFLLLGSASPRLVRQVSETLAGRVFRIEMGGFVASEVGPHHQNTLWLRGGFPDAFISGSDAGSLKWRRDFISDFLQRDLPALAESRLSVQQLRRLLLLLAGYNGSCINASSLGRDIGVDFKTVQRYLDVLEGSYIVRVLPPFFANVPKRVRKAPKLFFRDTGILHALLSLETTEQLQTCPTMGFSWESFCLEHLIREADLAEEDCFHYSVQGGAELDMVTIKNGSRFGFEFKHNDTPRLTKSMFDAAEDLQVKRVFQIYPGPDTFPLDDGGRFFAVAWRDLASLRSRMQ